MRAQLLHLSGPLRGRTRTYEDPVVRVGSAAHVEVTLEHALVAGIMRASSGGKRSKFHLRRDDGQVFVNGDEVEEIIPKDGDLIKIRAGRADGAVPYRRADRRGLQTRTAACSPTRRRWPATAAR